MAELKYCVSISLFFQTNYYRPQSSDTCYPCDCFPSGSHTRSCDRETGQCPCKPGVIGRQCNRCDNPFAEVTIQGCEGTILCSHQLLPAFLKNVITFNVIKCYY